MTLWMWMGGQAVGRPVVDGARFCCAHPKGLWMNPVTLVLLLVRSMPLLVGLVVLAAVLYGLVAAFRSPSRAKAVLIRVFTVLTSFLTVFFCVVTAYAWLENNLYVMELAGACAGVSAAAFVLTRLGRRLYLRNHPNANLR